MEFNKLISLCSEKTPIEWPSACDEAVYLAQIAEMPSHVSAIEMWGHYQ